jgi:septum formation protein
MKLILASQSKGRAALLKSAGYRFRIIPSHVSEPDPAAGAPLEDHVLELAILKARAIAERHPEAIVIGADTALILGRHIIGKPESMAGACRMLEQLGGRRHRISSAACIIFPASAKGGKRRTVHLVDTAYVTLRKWTPGQIRAHVALTRPLSWAGAYAVQDPSSAAIVERIAGDLATVIGLPMAKMEAVLGIPEGIRVKKKMRA